MKHVSSKRPAARKYIVGNAGASAENVDLTGAIGNTADMTRILVTTS